jgi:hypothetical protein
VLLLVGELDSLVEPAALRQLAATAGAVQLERIPLADHFFGGGLADLSRLSASWLEAGG